METVKDHYVIDLDSTAPSVAIYPREMIEVDLEYFGLSKPMDLSDFDWRVFETETEARAWLKSYRETLATLDNRRHCKSRDVPCILLKRRYMAQTLLGDKTFTERSAEQPKRIMRGVRVGDLFNFYDQKYFVTVRLKKVTERGRVTRYDFELP